MSDILSVIFYVTLFLISAAIIHIGLKRNSKLLVGISLAIPILIGGLRYGVGADYFGYVSFFERLSRITIEQFRTLGSDEGTEPGFFLLIKLSEVLTGDYVLMFLLSSLMTVTFFYFGLRRFHIAHKSLVYLLFLLMMFPFTLNAVRQGIAISLCFYALSFVMDRKLLKYSLAIAAASLFHISVLLVYPVYFLNRIIKQYKHNTNIQVCTKIGLIGVAITVLVPLLANLVMSFGLFERYDIYQISTGAQSSYDFLFRLLTITIALVVLHRATAKQDTLFILFCLCLAIIDLALSTIGFSSTFIARIGLYFTLFGYILVTYLVDVFDDRLGKNVARLVVILYGVAYFIITYYYFGQSDVIPYQFIMQGRGL